MNIKTKIMLLSMGIILSLHSSSYTSTEEYEKFKDFESSMKNQHLPLTLIVGCGHGNYHRNQQDSDDHAHSNTWCVNLDKESSGLSSMTAEAFKQQNQHDQILDISTWHPFFHTLNTESNKKAPCFIRDLQSSFVPTQDIIRYKNKFDAVVLERITPATLNQPWTIWNAVHMLKIGGELIIDSTMGYTSDFYTNGKGGFCSEVCPTDNSNYPVNTNHSKLEKFGINDTGGILPLENPDMRGICNYLSFWGLTDIVNVGDRNIARQPYTMQPGQDLKTARKTRIVSATKTQETENKMEEWALKIQKATYARPMNYRKP